MFYVRNDPGAYYVWYQGVFPQVYSGQSMKVNTCLLLLKHRMGGAVPSCLLDALKAYCFGTGVAFRRIYNFRMV